MSAELKNASLVKRLASLLYEALLLIAIWALVTLIFLSIFGDATSGVKRFALQLVLWMTSGAYFLWCWLKSGQTLAMQTWKLKLISFNGELVSERQAIKRYAFATLGTLFFCAGFIWAIFDRDGLFLHDRLSGTRQVKI